MTDDDGHAIGYKVLRRGTPVRASDGVQIGTVRRAQDNAREHIFDGIVIDTPDGRRFVDAGALFFAAAAAYAGYASETSRQHILAEIDASKAKAEQAKALPEPSSGLSARMRNTTTARRVKRLGRSMRDRWDQR